MTEDIENELRRRLAPVDAPVGFTDRVMRALPADVKPAVITALPASRRSWMQRFGIPTALAASLLAAVMLGRYSAEQRELRAEREGLEASRELMQALRLTSEKLDIAYQAVQSPPPADTEENRS
jgi:hypothetical protein